MPDLSVIRAGRGGTGVKGLDDVKERRAAWQLGRV
jgi:hypothetical protein